MGSMPLPPLVLGASRNRKVWPLLKQRARHDTSPRVTQLQLSVQTLLASVIMMPMPLTTMSLQQAKEEVKHLHQHLSRLHQFLRAVPSHVLQEETKHSRLTHTNRSALLARAKLRNSAHGFLRMPEAALAHKNT